MSGRPALLLVVAVAACGTGTSGGAAGGPGAAGASGGSSPTGAGGGGSGGASGSALGSGAGAGGVGDGGSAGRVGASGIGGGTSVGGAAAGNTSAGGTGMGAQSGASALGGNDGTAAGAGRDDGAAGSSAASGRGGAAGAAAGGFAGSAGGSASGGHGGAGGSGAAAGSGGTSGLAGPCDIYVSAATPCVAAHSTVRALYGGYDGKLYQVRRASDKTTKDIGVLSAGGVADSAAQDTFCSGTTCTISTIYDQSPNENHLTKAPAGGWLHNGGLEANATAAKITLQGHAVYGVYTTMNWDDDIGAVGYRNNQAKGLATGDDPETMYMVVDGKHYNQYCCFDYGNAETNNADNGNATMETLFFGNSTQWSKGGTGTGPWVMADLENGVYSGGDPKSVTATNTPLVGKYVTAMLKGPSGNRFVLRGGDAQQGALATKYDGVRPPGYSPQKKEGAIILGIGGDNSHTGEGTFFEGCITTGVPSDATDDAIQANIVAAGYGK